MSRVEILIKLATISMEDVVTGVPGVMGSVTYGRNIGGDTAHKLAPKGVKIKAEKTGRRLGILGGIGGSIGTLLLLKKHDPKIYRYLLKHMEPDAARFATTLSKAPLAIGGGALMGYPAGATSALYHKYTKKAELNKLAKLETPHIKKPGLLRRGLTNTGKAVEVGGKVLQHKTLGPLVAGGLLLGAGTGAYKYRKYKQNRQYSSEGYGSY